MSGARGKKPDPDGLLLIDKPSGNTSHDVVAVARRKLQTRRVGHAGTLDPLATGLLVLLVGDATRVASYVTAEDKRYEATIVFGRGTDSLDADGVETETGEVTADLRAALVSAAKGELVALLSAALAGELARTEQVPPSVSALHVDGERAHDRVRRGETVVLPARMVKLLAAAVTGADPDLPFPSLRLSVHVSKGYYVRSLARDLGAALGIPAHLGALRRTTSGKLDVKDAISIDDDFPAALMPLLPALSSLFRTVALTEEGELRGFQGRKLEKEHFASPPTEGIGLWIGPTRRIVAIGEWTGELGQVCRGFPPEP